MATYKTTWQYFGANAGRWSEVFYSNSTTLTVQAATILGLIDKRLLLLNATNRLLAIRISDVGNPRVTTILQVGRQGNDPGPVIGAFTPALAPANAGEAAVVLLSSTAVAARRYWWCRGISEYAVARDTAGATVPAPAFISRLQDWILAISNAAFIIYKRTPADPLDTFDYRVIQVGASSLNGRCDLIVAQAPVGIVAGSAITLQQFSPKEYPGLSGRFQVKKVVGSAITVQYVTPTDAVTAPRTGTWRPLTYILNAVIVPAGSAFSYLGVRSTRNFSSNSRGARSARKIRNTV